MRVLVTGGSGFIGSAVIRYLLQNSNCEIINLDKLTYAAVPGALAQADGSERYSFVHADICDRLALDRVLEGYQPDLVMHLAAESHVDRSIDSPAAFMETNIVGTYSLLEAVLNYWRSLPGDKAKRFRLHHISTDEVFGSLGANGYFTEETPYSPRSPYSASKAASDHLVQAWHHTFGLPTVMSNCSNNYGPYQFPEKLIPLMIINALKERELPVYGKGDNVRDWLYVDDHAEALWLVARKGRIGETYNIGGACEKTNLEVVRHICNFLDSKERLSSAEPRNSLIKFVTDRPGHDHRYAIDFSKLQNELAWQPRETFESGMAKTIDWYCENESWWQSILDERYNLARLGSDKNGTRG